MNRKYTVLFSIFLLMTLGMVAVGGFFYRIKQQSCRKEAENNLAAIANLKVSDISTWRKERLGDANVIFGNSAFSALVRRCLEQPQDLPLQEELRDWIGRIQTSYRYDRITLLDATGNKWISVPEVKEPHSMTTKKVRESLRSKTVVFEDFYRDENTHKIYLRLLVPILDTKADRRLIGMLMLRIDPTVYLFPDVLRWPTLSNTAEVLLIRREGNEAVFLNELKFQRNAALNCHVSLDRKDAPAVQAALGQEGIQEGIDYRGVPVLAAVSAVPNSPWFLVAKIDVAEVYASMQDSFWLTVIIVGILLYGVRAVWGFLWRKQHTDLRREKDECELKYRSLFEGSSDAYITIEPPFRAVSTSNLAMRKMFLLNNPREVTTIRPWSMSPKWQPDGRDSEEKAKEMLATALCEGSHLFEWTCMRSNGEEFPSVVLLTRVEQAGKVIIQATIRDITEQKRAEKTLLEFKTAVQQSVDGIALANLDGYIFFVNQAWATMHGCSIGDPIGKHFSVFHTQEQLDVEMNPFYERLLKNGSNEGEVGHVRKDGSVFPAWMSCTLLIGEDQKPFGAMAIARDITERKQAERKLLESKEQLEQYAAALQSTNQALEEFNGFAEAATRAKS
jgi:PAS domain S-box-containing protein